LSYGFARTIIGCRWRDYYDYLCFGCWIHWKI